MGCTCGGKFSVEVDLVAEKVKFEQGSTDFQVLRNEIMKHWKNLALKGFYLQDADSSRDIKTQNDYNSLLSNRKKLNLKVVLCKPFAFTELAWKYAAGATCKLARSNELAGTGFLITKGHIITNYESVHSRDSLKDLTAIFEDQDMKIPIKEDGVFFDFPDNSKTKYVLLELDTSMQKNKAFLNVMKPIKLCKQTDFNNPIKVTAIYYTRPMPTRQADLNGTIQSFDENYMIYSQELREGSSGAPILNSECELVGIYSAFYKGEKDLSENISVLSINCIIKTFKEHADSSNLGLQLAIKEILHHSGIEILQQEFREEISQIDESLSVMKIPTSSSSEEEFEEIKHEEIIPEEEPNMVQRSVYVNNEDNILELFEPGEDKSVKYNNIPIFGDGISAVSCRHGVVITGPDLNDITKAWIFNGVNFKELPETLKRHDYHGSVYYSDRLYLISGKFTRAVEYFDFETYQWTMCSKLPKARSYVSACVTDAAIYIFGGYCLQKQKAFSSILKYENDSWTKLPIKLHEKQFGMGAVALSSSTFLIFGGERPSKTGGYKKTKRSWYINTEEGSCTAGPKVQVSDCFNSYSMGIGESEIVVFSSTGHLQLYDLKRKKFFMINLD
jgi:V8-like Glu-specific endopeptidase